MKSQFSRIMARGVLNLCHGKRNPLIVNGCSKSNNMSVCPLACDNQAIIHIAGNPIFHEQIKHIGVNCHFIRDHLKHGHNSLSHI